jgi:hypothetical protein
MRLSQHRIDSTARLAADFALGITSAGLDAPIAVVESIE